MKATRFQSTALRFGVMAALVILVSGVSLAQVAMPVAPGANTQFGRLSWYASMTNFDNTISGATNIAFGVYGQANDISTANPSGHGSKLGFGIFGYTGHNGLFGGAAHSMVDGAGRNTGFWALGSNPTSPLLSHTAADTTNTLAVGLEVGAQANRGLAIMVDSGDVWLAAPGNTTTVQNLVVNGTFSGGNNYAQALSTATVVTTATTSAVLQAATTDATNNNPVINATSIATTAGGVVFKGTATTDANGAHLMSLVSGASTVFDVNNAGDLTIGTGTGKFTVAAGTGNTQIAGTANVDGDFSVNKTGVTPGTFTIASADGSLALGAVPATRVFTVDGTTGATKVAGVTTGTTSAFTITNTNTGATHSLDVSGNNQTGYTSNLTNTGSTKWTMPTAPHNVGGSAALSVVYGAIIDTLNVSENMQFGTTTTKATVDFSNATITGLSGNNKFAQDKTADAVQISASTAAGVEIQMSSPTGPNTNPALLANQNAGGTGKLLELQNAGADVYTVGNTGDLTIGTGAGKFTVAAATGNTVIAGTTDAQGEIYNSTGATVNINDSAYISGGLSLGGASYAAGTFIAEQSGKTTINDATTSGGYSLNVTNTLGGATGGSAATFTGSNRANYSVNMASDNNRTTFVRPASGNPTVGGSAALLVTRGAVIDTLDVSGRMEFGTDASKAVVDFTNAIVTGLISNDSTKVDFHTGNVQQNMTNKVAIEINNGAGGTNSSFIKLDSGATVLFEVKPTGNTVINPLSGADGVTVNATGAGNGVVATATGGSAIEGTSTSSTTTDAGVKATGNGAGAAAALSINNGSIITGGAANPAGKATGTIVFGTRSITITVANALVTANSQILVTARPTDGTAVDSYVAVVTARTAGTSFDVKVTAVEGDAYQASNVTVDYLIVN